MKLRSDPAYYCSDVREMYMQGQIYARSRSNETIARKIESDHEVFKELRSVSQRKLARRNT